ncbi:MAG: hypothetical protein V1808_03915 [Candidatus Daviesbacteria bacterium]
MIKVEGDREKLLGGAEAKLMMMGKPNQACGFNVPTCFWEEWMKEKSYLNREDIKKIVENAYFPDQCLLAVSSGIKIVSIRSSAFFNGEEINFYHYLSLRNGLKPPLIHKIQKVIGLTIIEHREEQIEIENVDYKYFSEFLRQSTLL